MIKILFYFYTFLISNFTWKIKKNYIETFLVVFVSLLYNKLVREISSISESIDQSEEMQ